jgi:GxxExxY protein
MESVYEACLCRELELRGIAFQTQVPVPVDYKGLILDNGFRLDMLVEKQVVIEVKAVDGLLPIHEAQLLTYMKLGGWKVGLLMNFNMKLLKQGIVRMVYGLDEQKLDMERFRRKDPSDLTSLL